MFDVPVFTLGDPVQPNFESVTGSVCFDSLPSFTECPKPGK